MLISGQNFLGKEIYWRILNCIVPCWQTKMYWKRSFQCVAAFHSTFSPVRDNLVENWIFNLWKKTCIFFWLWFSWWYWWGIFISSQCLFWASPVLSLVLWQLPENRLISVHTEGSICFLIFGVVGVHHADMKILRSWWCMSAIKEKHTRMPLT